MVDVTAVIWGQYNLPDRTPRRGTVTITAETPATGPSPRTSSYVTRELIAGGFEITLDLDDPLTTYTAVVYLDRGREVIGPITGIALSAGDRVDLNTLQPDSAGPAFVPLATFLQLVARVAALEDQIAGPDLDLVESPPGSGAYTTTGLLESPPGSGAYDIPLSLVESPPGSGAYLIPT